MKNVLDSARQNQQMTVAEVLWLTTAIAMIFAYARSWGEETVVLAAWTIVLVGIAGVVSGWLTNFKDAFFWSAVGGLIVFLAVAGGRLPSQSVAIGWGAVGAFCGGMCGAKIPVSALPGTVASGCMGCLAMLVCLVLLRQSVTGLVLFDVVCAALVGLVFRPFFDFLQWFEVRSGRHRVVLVSWLTLCMLLGNFLVPIVGGVER